MTFVAGTVLTAAALNTALAAKSDYAPTQNTQTGVGASAYTFVLADATRMTVANAATAATYTIPPAASVAFVANSVINVTSIGAGTITFAAGAGVTVTNTAGTLGQYQAAMLVRTASNAWTVVPFAGGASLLKSSDVSATTGSPTITTSGGYTIYQFTGSGSITLGKTGLCDILVIGGGGGATGGGGGAGGYISTTAYLPSGANTVTVGAGGVGETGYNSYNGLSSGVGYYIAPGGGGGARDQKAGVSGGSGGGGGSNAGSPPAGGSGTAGIGNAGGNGSTANANGGGGGAGAAGAAASGATGGAGGVGLASSITGASVTRGGGGGSYGSTAYGAAGTGGGGGPQTAGTANTGGGGGALSSNGGSGIVIVRVLT